MPPFRADSGRDPRCRRTRSRCFTNRGRRDKPGGGAIGVVELDRIDDVHALRRRFVAEGVFVRPFGATVYLTPAFTIAPDDLARLTGAVVRGVGEM
jgi:adenosylmethionine---8-amino-7-oxononanoate aminotransferase